jgi:septum formation protein
MWERSDSSSSPPGEAAAVRRPDVTGLQADRPPVVLASASTARRRLLEAAGLRFTCVAAAIDEDAARAALRSAGASAEDAATALAEMKAARVAAGQPPEAIVIGADQILVCDGSWYDKAADGTAARAQLLALAGRPHALATAVVGFRGGVRVWHRVETARLWMRPFDRGFVERYLEMAGAAVLGSVGCYQLEALGAHLFVRVEGDPFTIQGLPLLALLAFLREQGVVAT